MGYLQNHRILILLSTLTFAAGANAQCTIASSSTGASLIELYTSEGCNSCPPAEAWQNKFKKHPGLWTKYVPIAFHVGYWDYLGWKDKLADPAHVLRQRNYRSKGLARAIYTPGFFVNGKEWRGFFGSRTLPKAKIDRSKKLTVIVSKNKVDIKLDGQTPHSNLVAHVVLLGFDIKHNIQAGENHGRVLKHDFAALHYIHKQSRQGKWSIAVDTTASYKGYKPGAIAVWLSRNDHPVPLIVSGGWLKNCLK